MKGDIYRDRDCNRVLTALVTETDMAMLGRVVIERAAQALADDWVKKYGAEVLARITPEAIATLTMAEAGAAINTTLHQKLPDKIVEVVRKETEVWQRGVFGGVRRIR